MLLTSVLFQTNKFKCISVHGDSHLQIQEILLAAYHCTAGSSSKPHSSLLLHSVFTAHNQALQAQLPVPCRGLSFAWHSSPFRGLAVTFLCLPPPSTTLQFWWKQPPDWGTQRQQLFLETSCSRGVVSNHKLQLYHKI